MRRGGGRAAWAAAAVGVALASPPATARAWSLFERNNPRVEAGNAALRAGDADAALAAYDEAARELPDAPGVQLDRGLALLARGDAEGARDALAIAARPEVPRELRADALYDVGLAFFRSAEARAEAEAHDEAQQLFREAADAFRRSLRVRPGDRDAAWNLELALRRLTEEREAQEKKEQEERERQEAEEEAKEQREPPEDPAQEEPEGDAPPPDGSQEPEAPSEPSPEGEGGAAPEPQEGEAPDADGRGAPEPGEPPPGPGEPQPDRPEEALPGPVERVLDALREDEQSFQRERAAGRARRDPRRPTKDW